MLREFSEKKQAESVENLLQLKTDHKQKHLELAGKHFNEYGAGFVLEKNVLKSSSAVGRYAYIWINKIGCRLTFVWYIHELPRIIGFYTYIFIKLKELHYFFLIANISVPKRIKPSKNLG